MPRGMLRACMTLMLLVGPALLAACGTGLATGVTPGASPAAAGVSTTAPVRLTPTPTAGAAVEGSPIRLVPGVVPEQTPAPALSPTPIPTVQGTDRTITLADNGKTITIPFAHRFLLALDPGYDWTVIVERPGVVVRERDVPGTQGVYAANSPERTKLSAVGDPPCRKAQPPCAAPSRTFEVEIVVEYAK